MAEENDAEALFKNVRYYVIGTMEEKIEKLLIDGKAKVESYLSGLATHALVTDYANLEVEEAKDVWQIPTVTMKWVEMSAKCNKLLPTDAFTPSDAQLFSGLIFCPSLMTRTDRNILWALVTFYGGRCQLNLNKTCTHLVVPTPSGKKYEESLKHPDDIKIVMLDWINDSVAAKSLQDVNKYDPALVIIPKEKSPEKETPKASQPSLQPQNIDEDANSDIITSSLQNLAVSTASAAPEQLKASHPATPTTNLAQVALVQQALPGKQVESQAVMQQSNQALVAEIGLPKGAPLTPAVSIGPIPAHMAMPTGPVQQPDKSQVQNVVQSISQPGQVMMAGQQITQQPQISDMGSVQQLQMQRAVTPIASTRFSMPQRFPSPTKPVTTPRHSSQSPRKAPTKRRKSGSRAKNATSLAASNVIPASPSHNSQMTNVMMTQQQMQNSMLQQQNQQMLMNQHRMAMMQQGGQATFIQQQMLQQQHAMRMQAKGQVTPPSPQKLHNQHMMVDQNAGAVRPGFSVNFANSGIRMQQHQPRPMQGQTPQMSPQQMMAVGFQSQMQIQQQQVKMSAAGSQQNQQQFVQQQPGVMPMTLPLQNHQQAVNSGKMQAQRMQVSPQQQAMYVHPQVGKETVSPRPPLQQHSPMTQQQMIQQQPHAAMTQQQRQQQQQLMMQQMARQQQMQLQQQLMQSPGNIQTQQNHTTPPSSHAPINVSDIGVISPTALQQGLILAQAQGFQPPLIHPSLQTPQDYGKATPQGNSAKSRRSKSRRTKDGDENAEGKPKPRSRGSRQKKSAQTPTSAASSPRAKKPQTSPGAGRVGSRNAFSPMVRGPAPGMGYYPTPMNVMTPPPHPTVPVAFSANKQGGFTSPTATVSPLVATENTYVAGHLGANANRTVPTADASPKVETHFLPQHVPTPPPPPHRGPFNDPLEAIPKSYEGRYLGHDPAENVPQELCLLGCVFVIVEYQEAVPETKVIDHWKKVINKFGGIVEDEYNACTCTHLLCISQSTSSFRDSLLEGKRCVTVYWLNDVLQIRELRPPWLALHVPTPYPTTQKPALKHNISYTGFHQKERERLKMMASVCGAKFSGFLSRSNTVLVCKGTLSLKYDKAREWRIPCANVHWLRDIMQGDTDAVNNPNQPKYQNFDENATDVFSLDETKMQQILDPWKVPVRVTLDCMQRARVKRKNSVNDVAVSTPSMKRPRTEGSYQPCPRVCFTGLPSKQVAELQKTLESLQGQTSKTINLSTHLVANCVSRTVKFLCAVSVCQYIVTPEWIDESAKSNWLLDEDKYLLQDKVAEGKYEFSLKESLSKARRKPLFKGYVFCMTDNVVPDRKTLTEIIECAGGKVVEKIPTTPVLKRLKTRKLPNNRLLLISCPADEQQVIRWKREGIAVHNAEIVLTGVLKQEVDETLYQL